MNSWLLCALIAGGFLCAAAGGATNVIVQHNPDLQEGTNYTIQQGPMQVFLILGVEGETFEFEAMTVEDPNDPNGTYLGPGDISNIIADPDAGPVRITIVGHNDHPYGARDVGEINLNATGVTGRVGDVTLRGTLAELGPLLAQFLDGALTVEPNEPDGGDILDDIEVDYLAGSITCKHMHSLLAELGTIGTPSITVREAWGGAGADEIYVPGDVDVLKIGTVSGTITLADAQSITFGNVTGTGNVITENLDDLYMVACQGSVTIEGSLGNVVLVLALTGTLQCKSLAGVVLATGAIHGSINIENDMIGSIYAFYGISGHLGVGGDAYGEIVIGSLDPLTYHPADLTGSVEVAGALRTARWEITRNLGDPNDPNSVTKGQIRVHGGFDPYYGLGALSIIGDRVSVGSCIVVDYDGYDPNDLWDPDLPIVIGDPNDPNHPPVAYTENTPELKLYKITACRGDLRNDGTVDFGDINPFIMALDDVLNGTSNYAAAFPGLEGSMLYHADADCSGEVNFGDINPFIARVGSGNCDCDEPRGDGMGGGDADPMPAEELAALLTDNVAPEQYETLVAIVAAAIDAATDEETQAYWQAVYTALTQ